MSWNPAKPKDVLPRIATLVNPTVTPSSCEIHLQHLQMFHELKGKDATADQIFLCRSERRYMDWLRMLHTESKTRSPKELESLIPPPDIQQVWHVHLLNPFNYITDTTTAFHRIIPHSLPSSTPTDLFTRQRSILLSKDPVSDMIDMKSSADDSEHIWKSFTHQSYIISPHDTITPIPWTCPICEKDTDIPSQQYSEWRMSTTLVRTKAEAAKALSTQLSCSHCKNSFTFENYGVTRLIRALDKQKKDIPASTSSLSQEAATDVLCVNGAVIDIGTSKVDVATTINELATWLGWERWDETVKPMISPPSTLTWSTWKSQIGQPQAVRLLAARKLRSIRAATIRRIIASYRNTIGPFSIDLIGAMVRQREFTAKMCHPEAYHSAKIIGNAPDALHHQMTHAIERYHKFLYLMYYAPSRMLVPTLDIDLAWHTHQLDPLAYQNTCMTIVLRMINHSDAVGAKPLDTGFIDTCKLWYKCFKEPYSTEAPSKKFMTKKKLAAGVLFFPYGIYLAAKTLNMKRKGVAGDKKHPKQSGCAIHPPQMRQTATKGTTTTTAEPASTTQTSNNSSHNYIYIVASCGIRTCGTFAPSCAVVASCGVTTTNDNPTQPSCAGSACGSNSGPTSCGSAPPPSSCASSCGGGGGGGGGGGSSCSSGGSSCGGSSCGSSGGGSSCGSSGTSSCGSSGGSSCSSAPTSSCSSGGSSCSSSGGSSCSSGGGSSCSSGGSSCSSGGSSCGGS